MKSAVIVVCCGLLVSCATVNSTSGKSAARGDAAQTVADFDRMVGSNLEVSDGEKAELKDQQKLAASQWLQGEIAAVGDDASDGALQQLQLLIAESDKRGLPDVAAAAEAREAALLQKRESELTQLIDAGQWLQALERVESWAAKARQSSAVQAIKQRARDQVNRLSAAAMARAESPAEAYLFRRMNLWVGRPSGEGKDVEAMRALTSLRSTLMWSESGCDDAKTVTVSSVQTGTPVTVELALGGCDVSAQRGSEQRRHTYFVEVEKQREEQYTVTVQVAEQVTTYSKTCHQVTKNIATSGPKNYITVSECNTTPSTNTVMRDVQETRTRLVKYIDKEARYEPFTASTIDYAVKLPIRVSVTGDEQLTIMKEVAASTEHDEAYSLTHGASRSFRSGVEDQMRRGLSTQVQALIDRALREWTVKRARARLAAAQAVRQSAPAKARALAVEGVVLSSSVATEAAGLVNINVDGSRLADLINGGGSVVAHDLSPGEGLALPAPSTSLEKKYARLEQRQATVKGTDNRDVLVGLGAGLLPTPDQQASGAFALEIQIGYVPTFAAITHLIARIEGDLQIFATQYAQFDLSARPEIGFRLGFADLSVIAAGGGRLAFEQVSLNPDDDGQFTALAYGGYGAHLALHLGPVLIDAMALRLHQVNARSPLATRVDGIVGFGLSNSAFLFGRMRYLAQADVLNLVKTADRFASFTLGIMLQF